MENCDPVHLKQFEYLRVTRRGPIAVVRLDRPPVNAVNQAMYAEIRELFGSFDELCADTSVVILCGQGPHFCAGNDLDEFLTLTGRNSPGRMKLVREAFSAIYDCPVPVIAAVQGSALGTGVALAGSCDLVICADSARFGTPEIAVGVMGGAKHLARLVPQQIVRRMYYTAEPITGRELMRYGGVVDVVADQDLPQAAVGLAERIARHSRVALRAAKESLNTIEYMPLAAGYEFEQRLTGRLADGEDSRESRRAIVERRPPAYPSAQQNIASTEQE